MRRGVVAVFAAWAVAAAGCGLLAGRMSALPAKGPAHPLDANGQALEVATAPGVPPDPGRGPLPACWVVPNYVLHPGEACPPRPHGEKP